MKPDQPEPAPPDDPVRAHVYDGIAEYDRRLPNWWLVTFYLSMAFAAVYWMTREQFSWTTDASRLQVKLDRLEAARLAGDGTMLDDASLTAMSRNPLFVAAGRSTFATTCVSCHGEKLTGGVGPNLVDATWLHGSQPTQVLATISQGVLTKGMPAWGPVLGTKKTSELVAYVLSEQPAAAE